MRTNCRNLEHKFWILDKRNCHKENKFNAVVAIRKEFKYILSLQAFLALHIKKGKKQVRPSWTADICRLSSDKVCLSHGRMRHADSRPSVYGNSMLWLSHFA